MIEARRAQLSFADGLIAEEVSDLWEDWMRPADRLLDDVQLLSMVRQALAQRRPQSRTRGRQGTPAEVVLRLLLLKHIRNWSYAEVEREVRANLVYRSFTRVGGAKVPDDTVINKWALALGPQVIEQLHQRLVTIAQQHKVVVGRKLWVDTTVVETNIHYPTDSSLLGDGVRVLTRAMKRVAAIAGAGGAQLRDRSRSVKYRMLEIGRAARSKGDRGRANLRQGYERLLASVSRVVGQAKRFSREIETGVKTARDAGRQAVIERLRKELDTMVPRVKQVMQQTRKRIFGGDTQVPAKLVSIFEPSTEVIRKGKAGKPTEFGKLVKFQEAENQIITAYEVYPKRPADSALLIPAIELHHKQLGRVPRLVAADAGFYSASNQQAAHQQGVKRVCIPNRNTKGAERKRAQKKPWFRQGQKWRTGCEGRISVVKRRHGLNRCRDKGELGMQRWVGLGVMADNLINIGRLLAHPTTSPPDG
ncbi:MAG: ISNCY family transposase [Deltaproteobacteria bacterium]|nr:ISNCY family transposase [Deltaproteobacteria bacterium]